MGKDKSASLNHIYNEDFEYSHDNPYHEKLKEFDEFVLRDDEAEAFAGKWNEDIFKRDAPLCLEVGSGYGHFMTRYCKNNPHMNYVGLDYRFKRSYQLAKKLSKMPKEELNFRYLRAKGERIKFLFGESELDKIFYFFPDPWPKKRHWKKRLFQKPFIDSTYHVLKPGGKLIIKTDHDGYAQWMAEEIAKQDNFVLEFETKDLRNEFPEHELSQFQTKFEKIFIEQQVPIKAFVLTSKKRDN